MNPFRKQILTVSLFLFIITGIPSALVFAENGTVTLKDGSVLNGEILSMGNGVVEMQSGSLGTVRIEQSKVRSIQFNNRGSGSAGSMNRQDFPAQINALQQMMMGSPEIMTLIEQLGSDPEFQEALNNPELINLIMSGNIQALINSPEIKKLLENPSVQSIQKKVGQ